MPAKVTEKPADNVVQIPVVVARPAPSLRAVGWSLGAIAIGLAGMFLAARGRRIIAPVALGSMALGAFRKTR